MNPAQMRLFAAAAAAVLASNCWCDPAAEWSANKDKTLDFCVLERLPAGAFKATGAAAAADEARG